MEKVWQKLLEKVWQKLLEKVWQKLLEKVWQKLLTKVVTKFCHTFSKSIYKSIYIVVVMSIVTLKRSSRRFIVPISSKGFSLNGGHRNQRAIGDTNLSALTNGQYNICDANDPSVVKLSTKNTKGYLYSTVTYPTCPPGVTPPTNNQSNFFKNFSPENNSQGVYIIDKVKAGSAACVTEKTDSGTNNPCLPVCVARSYWMGGRRVYITFNAKNSGKYGQGAISAGEYLAAGLLKTNCLPTPKALAKPVLIGGSSGCVHC